MAHIADFVGGGDSTMGMNNYIARELSPFQNHDAVFSDQPVHRSEDKEKFVWRMHQPTESRKYQLFPSKAAQRSQEDMLLSGNADKASSILGTSIGGRLKEANLVRRRKVSIPELGPTPMTTVQEVPMDSPTIPGRPALHERSTSAPGNDWRNHPFAESIISSISGPALDEHTDMTLDNPGQENNEGEHLSRTFTPLMPRQPLSPKTLAPLVIPQTSSRVQCQVTSARSRSSSESIPPCVPPKSARMREGSSPYPRASPYTPASATYTPASATSVLSASTAPTSFANTPNSAFPSSAVEGRTSPQPWSLSSTQFPTPSTSNISSPAKGHSRNQSDTDNINQRSFFLPRTPGFGHRRHESESGASIMDRGRPKKRSELDPIPLASMTSSSPMKANTRQSRTASIPATPSPPRDCAALADATAAAAAAAKIQAKADAQHAFEHLPTGTRPHLAPNHLPLAELAALKKQAMGQASRFQVLPTHAVEALSRELRALDERCEYLRKTHRSLRSGRRNLHERICNHLRGERTAVFSRKSLLRQEEALSELDNSIDDWVAKLEQAENRRTRIRQKLLEHVAAALIIPQPPAGSEAREARSSNYVASSPVERIGNGNSIPKAHLGNMASTIQVQSKISSDPNTPPRSPSKSPERLERVVEEVKSSSPEPKRAGREVESIRIYAESDVYALLADVEEEIERMGAGASTAVAVDVPERKRVLEVQVEKLVEAKKEAVLSPGLRLHAVVFEGMIAHKKSAEMLAHKKSAEKLAHKKSLEMLEHKKSNGMMRI